MLKELIRTYGVLSQSYGDEHPLQRPYKPVWFENIGKSNSIWGVHLTQEGEFIRLEEEEGTYLRPHSGRTSNVYAEVGADKAEYTFPRSVWGHLENAKEPSDRDSKKHESYIQALEDACEVHGGFGAILAFLEDVDIELPPEVKPHEDRFIFWVGDSEYPCHLNGHFMDYWIDRKNGEGSISNCVLTGEDVPCTRRHSEVMQKSWVSFNNSSYESWGLSGNENAEISTEAHAAYTSALDFLISGERRKEFSIPIGDDIYVCWRIVGGDQTGPSILPVSVGPTVKPSSFVDLFKQLHTESAVATFRNDECYFAHLTEHTKRGVIVDYTKTSMKEVCDNLLDWFEFTATVKRVEGEADEVVTPSLSALVSTFSGRQKMDYDSKRDSMLYKELMKVAMFGQSLGVGWVRRAQKRLKAKGSTTRSIQSILRFYLFQQGVHMDASLNRDNRDPGYLMGRFIFMVEKLQQVATKGKRERSIQKLYGGGRAVKAPLKSFNELGRKAIRAYLPQVRSRAIIDEFKEILSLLQDDTETMFEDIDEVVFESKLILGIAHQWDWYEKDKARRKREREQRKEKAEA